MRAVVHKRGVEVARVHLGLLERDLYKQQVWQLARHLELPEAVVAKPPSADLWPGQTDEEDLGSDYPTADEVLYLLYDVGGVVSIAGMAFMLVVSSIVNTYKLYRLEPLT